MTTALEALDYLRKATNTFYEARMRRAARRIREKLYRERDGRIGAPSA